MVKISRNLHMLLAKASEAVESFHPGHWEFLCALESRVQTIIRNRNADEAISFLTDVAFLKQPYNIDEYRKSQIKDRLSQQPRQIVEALDALADIDKQDYRVMQNLARLPYFGLGGGRAFASAVVRLVCPARFAIIDWRNLAVLSGADGFDGLIEPPVNFKDLSPERIVEERGHLVCSQELYEHYNNFLRDLASSHNLKVAEVDLALWTYSIQQKPFRIYQRSESPFDQIFGALARTNVRQRPKGGGLNDQLTHLVRSYISSLKELGWLSPEKVRTELAALFRFMRDECNAYGQNKPRINPKIRKITQALESSIKAPRGERLLAQWKRWEDMLNPASPSYIGIDLPGSMIMEGYVVFENLIPVREYLEEKYHDSSFEPVEAKFE